ncbi:hypothetical protein [Microlunatus flavus]|uniref:hypothetical protein n=1 Tax=Microlunatus flavus TaxID=1036181 RepID=UPI000B860842|nr:hypothetical protein [Microlunatus flavus]
METVSAWGAFPPLPDGASETEVSNYLDRCSVARVLVDAESQVTVELLDVEQQTWTFHFGQAGLSVSRWPDPSPHARRSSLSGSDWEAGIFYLSTSSGMADHGRLLYEVESKVSILIEADSVVVTPPVDTPEHGLMKR